MPHPFKKSFSKIKPNTFKHWNITLKILIESYGIERKYCGEEKLYFLEWKKMKNILEESLVSFLTVIIKEVLP